MGLERKNPSTDPVLIDILPGDNDLADGGISGAILSQS